MATGDSDRGIRSKHQGAFNPSQSLATPATPVWQSEQQQPTAMMQGQSWTLNREKYTSFIKATVGFL